MYRSPHICMLCSLSLAIVNQSDVASLEHLQVLTVSNPLYIDLHKSIFLSTMVTSFLVTNTVQSFGVLRNHSSNKYLQTASLLELVETKHLLQPNSPTYTLYVHFTTHYFVITASLIDHCRQVMHGSALWIFARNNKQSRYLWDTHFNVLRFRTLILFSKTI